MFDRKALRQALVLALALSLILIGACVPAYEARLAWLRDQGDLRAADRLLADAAARDPENPAILRERGIVALERGNPEAAIPLLEKALRISPDDGRAALYLGVACELDRRWTQAVVRYERAEALAVGSPELNLELTCRRQAVESLRLAEFVQTRVAAERAGELEPGARVLVLPFAVEGDNEVARNLRLGLAALLASDLHRAPVAESVPFHEVLAFLDALDVPLDSPIDPDLRERLARLTGARFVVDGKLSELNDLVSVTSVVVDRTAEPGSAARERRLEYQQSRVGTVLELEKTLLVRVAKVIEVELTSQGAEALRIFSSRSGLAVVLYGEALRLIEAGDQASAEESIGRALGLDPEFSQAREAHLRISFCGDVADDPHRLLRTYEGDRRTADASARERALLAETTQESSRIGGPEGEERDLSLNRAGGASGTVTFPVRLPR
jgi:tetratricopeptide (TPR) repeat protein